MALLNHPPDTKIPPTLLPTQGTPGKRRMSLFSFGSSHSIHAKNPSSNTNPPALPPISTSPGALSQQPAPSSNAASPRLSARALLLQNMNGSFFGESNSLAEIPASNIFERSVQDMALPVKQEDYIPPALDATAQILSDKDTDLDNVEMVYSSRRNSSVIGLNMALGRPVPPLRKNSVYSTPQQGNFPGFTQFPATAALQSSLANPANPQSPVSPPKLMSSRSSVSFYSYADMINNDEFSRRPSLMHAYSQGFTPTVGRKMSVASNHSVTSGGNTKCDPKFPRKGTLCILPSLSQSQLSKQFKERLTLALVPQRTHSKTSETSSLKKFLISPESSDSEEQEYHPASSVSSKPYSRRNTITSNRLLPTSQNEEDSLVLTSMGDCIRQRTTEIGGN